ncbi:hypothetical protein ACHAWF_006769 [Thalassiosira exigua]
MACRKNAYRGMVEMSEYLEKQSEEAARHRRAFEAEQRRIWTPPSVSEGCCLDWLAHGPHRAIRTGGNLLASVASSRGCGGCSKAHPRIALAADGEGASATAALSHALDPWTRFFEGASDATRVRPLTYRLDGLLSDHRERIEGAFGSHLVTVDRGALAASRRARERRLARDDERRAAKRRKALGDAAPADLLARALEVCRHHSLRDHLDVADIAWMRTSCKAMGRIAARMARDRMRGVELTYRGAVSTGRCHCNGRDKPFGKLSRVDNDDLFVFRPEVPLAIDWSGRIRDEFLRIDIVLDQRRLADMPENRLLFPEASKRQRLAVTKYFIEIRDIISLRDGGELFKIQSNVQSRPMRREASNVGSCMSADRSHGEIGLRTVAFAFHDFLGVYVRKKLAAAKQKYNSSQVKNPADKAYIKALAKAAREAPGNADSFRGMEGW